MPECVCEYKGERLEKRGRGLRLQCRSDPCEEVGEGRRPRRKSLSLQYGSEMDLARPMESPQAKVTLQRHQECAGMSLADTSACSVTG